MRRICLATAREPPHAYSRDASLHQRGCAAKVAGPEISVTEPQTTFSPCCGGPFLVWHLGKYAELPPQKLTKHNARAWLVDTSRGSRKHPGPQTLEIVFPSPTDTPIRLRTAREFTLPLDDPARKALAPWLTR